MIFVTLGTFEMKFERILKEIERLDLKDEVIIQSGYTDFKSGKNKVVKFMDKEDFKENLNRANIVICHGGIGSILEALNNNKKVIAIPRLQKYSEHVDNHQIEIVEKLTKQGYILSSKNEKDLKYLIEKAKTFNFKRYHSDTQRLIDKLEMYIDLI